MAYSIGLKKGWMPSLSISYIIASLSLRVSMVMTQFVLFINTHWLLSALFVLTLILLIGYEIFLATSNIQEVSPQQALQLINHQEALLLDCRNLEAYRSGHILNAMHIDAKELVKKVMSLKKYQSKPIILIVSLDQDKKNLVQLLTSGGFSQVMILNQGLDRWKAENLPLVKL